MAKFNTKTTHPVATQPGTTTGTTTTYEGGHAWNRDSRSDLMLLAVVNMVGEDTFYESAKGRDNRFRQLVRSVAVQYPQWTLDFIGWLRGSANMRSASVVAACEAVKARLDSAARGEDISIHDKFNDPGFNRRFINAACVRADEPGEIVSYWQSQYGRSLPQSVRRGLGDVARKLYTERNLIKYDGGNKAVRFADVLELTHPFPAADKPWQGPLFKYAIDRRHNRESTEDSVAMLPVLANYEALMATPVADRRAKLLADDGAAVLNAAGMTWEAVGGWLQGPMDAKAWEAIIPSMGAMALVRNLRNFDEAGVSDGVAATVCARLSDPETIRKSRMFPYRMLQAYGAAPSLRWGGALEKALGAACQNVPSLTGKTLVLVDTSGSMTTPVSARSNIAHMEVGALFGVALAAKGNDVDLVGFATGHFDFPLAKGGSVLRQTEAFCKMAGTVGHSTQTVAAIKARFKPGVHQRVVVITDQQTFSDWSGDSVSASVPKDVPLFAIDTTGYSKSSIDTSQPNRFEIGGFSDAMFTVLGLLADGKSSSWPWTS